MQYFCASERRRIDVGKHPRLRGIDFLEVSADQRRLRIHFLPADGVSKTAVPQGLTAANVTITGGERITGIAVAAVAYDAGVLVVTVNDDGNPANGVGDFSPYRLHLVNVPNLDPVLSVVEFSFKVECPTDFDCRTEQVCPPNPLPAPEIDYLAKDYTSFRRMMLDRLALLMPEWKERSPADVGVALVELLAYVGDYLSYQQDAVATEAYIGTARRRVSVRRHARLVDYFMHDGCNARVWVAITAAAGTNGTIIPGPRNNRPGTILLTKVNASRGPLSPDQLDSALSSGATVFETMHDLKLYDAHNKISFYTWGDEDCCLARGATRATLKGHYPHLKPGAVLLFEEVLGPETGKRADADPTHRHAVRLTRSECTDQNNPSAALTDPLNGQRVTEIEWHSVDALPFPVCLREFPQPESAAKEPATVARGNIVLADHGITIVEENLGGVAGSARFRPSLSRSPLTQAAVSLDLDAPASAAFRWELRNVLPAITLNQGTWLPRRDLLSSNSFAQEFVVELESDGSANLRFGDDKHGKRPNAAEPFTAAYRVGNGVSGNVGAEAIAHAVVADTSRILEVRNPLPARGGIEPETIEEVRQRAPYAFRTLERAVTKEDYASVTERHPEVQRAAATFRWTGSWHTTFLTVDRFGGIPVDTEFEKTIRADVERYRLAGYDLEVDSPRLISLEVELDVCVKPDYFRSDVKAVLLNVLSNGVLPDGRRGVFHPDNFTFGQPVYLSPLYAATQAVAGVQSVKIRKFQRQGTLGTDTRTLDAGKLEVSRLEIARLDNNPNFPEHGVLRLNLSGGK